MSIKLRPELRKKNADELYAENMQLKAELQMLRKRLQGDAFRFTKDELVEHDKMVIKRARENYMAELKAESWRMQQENQKKDAEYFDMRMKQFKSANPRENLFNYFCYTAHLFVDTMVNDFGWSTPPNDNWGDRRYKAVRLIQGAFDRINGVMEDEVTDVVKESEKWFKKYRVAFRIEEEEDAESNPIEP